VHLEQRRRALDSETSCVGWCCWNMVQEMRKQNVRFVNGLTGIALFPYHPGSETGVVPLSANRKEIFQTPVFTFLMNSSFCAVISIKCLTACQGDTHQLLWWNIQ